MTIPTRVNVAARVSIPSVSLRVLVSLTELLGNKSEITSAKSFALAALKDEDDGAPIDMKLIQV